MPRLTLIAAMDLNHTIGAGGDLPWHLPEDLKFFKRETLGKPIIMGRKTFASVGRPLPKRHNIVITRDPHWIAEGVTVAHSPSQALELAGDVSEIMICGGGEIYRLFMEQADRMLLTFVMTFVPNGDTEFPHWDPSLWSVAKETLFAKDDRHAYHMNFMELTRNSPSS